MPRQKFKFQLRHYASVYGCSLRQIQRYSAKGYPLDDETTTRTLIAGGVAVVPGTGGPASPAQQGSEALGLGGFVQRLREEEAVAHRNYQEALKENNPGKAAACLHIWQELGEQLTKSESSNPKVQEANKSSITAGEVKIVLSDLFFKLREDWETLPRRVAMELVGKDEITIREILDLEVREIIEAIYSCKFLEDTEGE